MSIIKAAGALLVRVAKSGVVHHGSHDHANLTVKKVRTCYRRGMKLLFVYLIANIGLVGCAMDSYEDDIAVDPAGVHFQYVIDSIELPTSGASALMFGLDLDGDEQGRPDNALGQVFATLVGSGVVDPNETVAEALASGSMLHLLDVQATSLDEAGGVGVLVFLGDDTDSDPTDNFLGGEQFDVRLANVTRTMAGVTNGGLLAAGPGQMPVELVLPGVTEPFMLHLEGARIQASIESDQLRGTLAGAILAEDVDAVIIPVIYQGVAVSIERDCVGTVCEPGTNGELFLELFDDNTDGEVSLEELRNNGLVKALLAPDVDLFDENGRFAPRKDGIRDSLSIGFHFTAVPASFQLPL